MLAYAYICQGNGGLSGLTKPTCLISDQQEGEYWEENK